MHFRPNYPIYLQVADYICEKVLTGTWHNGAKLPSVKELAVATSVNPNTVIKALTHLQDNDILTTQRGIGYFLTDEASANTIELKRRQFVDDDLPAVFSNMKLLGLTLADVQAIYQQQGSRDEQG